MSGVLQRLLLFVRRVAKGIRGRVRRVYYRLMLGHVGSGCMFTDGILIAGPENIFLGDGVVLNEGVILQSCEGARITIGDHAHLAYGAVVITGNLDFSEGRVNADRHVSAPVTVGHHAVIGARAILMPGVEVGAGAVVSAGSVVTGKVEAGNLVFGNPARVLKRMEVPDQ